jgi:hemolysin-activating ACP:hemolysin acyltransferase
MKLDRAGGLCHHPRPIGGDMASDETRANAGGMSMSADLSSQPQLTPEQEGQLRSRGTATAFGEVVGALLRSDRHRRLRLQDVEARFAPAMVLGQFAVAHAQVPNRPGETAPVALIIWAMVSEATDARLQRETSFPLTIQRDEWRSGTIPWLVDVAGPREAVHELVRQLSTQVLQGGLPKFPAGAV